MARGAEALEAALNAALAGVDGADALMLGALGAVGALGTLGTPAAPTLAQLLSKALALQARASKNKRIKEQSLGRNMGCNLVGVLSV